MNWQDIIQENRRIIRNGIVAIVFLAVVLIVLLVVNQIIDNQDKYTASTTQAEASVNEIDPSPYLEELHATIKKAYGDKLNGFQIADGKLLGDGSWYITTIYEPQQSQWDPATDTYKIILHKDSDKWQIAAEPSLIFSYVNYPDVPHEIIMSANNL